MADYSIKVKDKNGDELGEFTQWTNLNFSEKQNDYGECRFDVPITSSELLDLVAARRYETYVVRNGSVVWSGEQVARSGDLKANSPNYLTIVSRTFFEMLNARYTGAFVRFNNIDQGTILKSLVDTSQALTDGDLGFTFGSHTTGTNRDREYSNQNIMEAFINMSNVINGPDFFITHDKEINIVSFKGIDKSAQAVLEWGTNLESVNIIEDFSTPANQAIVLGAGFGSSQTIGTSTDTSARATYKLRQQRSSEIDVSGQSVLEAKAQALVRKYKQSLLSLSIVQLPNTNPGFSTVSLGDSIRVKIKEGIYNINNRFRVYGYNVQVDDNNKETISYLVGQI